jgi:hypothetical protein
MNRQEKGLCRDILAIHERSDCIVNMSGGNEKKTAFRELSRWKPDRKANASLFIFPSSLWRLLQEPVAATPVRSNLLAD